MDDIIIKVVEADFPVTLRGVYYRVVSTGNAPKTEAMYRTVGQRLLKLRRSGRISYNRITDGTRWVIRPSSSDDLVDALISTASV